MRAGLADSYGSSAQEIDGIGRKRISQVKKLIEVALPLEAINKASAREKSIRHGHPSTLHLWWARRPLAAARAVIFAQMVDDPSAHPDIFKTEKAQEKERQRLFKIIEDLVLWENTTNEEVLQRARDEIWQSWREPARTTRIIRAPKNYSIGTNCPRFTIRSPVVESCRWRRSGLGLESLRQRPESGCGSDQQSDDRDPSEVRRQTTRQSRVAAKDRLTEWVERRARARRRCALLRQVDARRSRETHRSSLSQGRSNRRDGERSP